MSPKTLPGIGVFGTGNIVRVIIPILREQGFKIEAIWGRTLREAMQVSQDLSIPFHTIQIDDVLLNRHVDFIVIFCSPNLHAQISVKALGIGKHVLCDKPAGLSQSDALKMVKASQYYPSLISILNHSLRFLPIFIRMREAINSGLIGGVTLVDVQIRMNSLLHDRFDWLCDATMGGGTLTMVGSHVIDLITHLTGKKATRVHAVVRTFKTSMPNISGIRTITASDFCTFQMELTDGVFVTTTINTHLTGSFSQEILVCGTRGHLIAKDEDLVCTMGGKEETLHAEKNISQLTEDSSLPKPYLQGLRKMVFAIKEAFLPPEHHIGWVKEPVANAATFEDGLYVQAVIDALNKSSANREWEWVQVLEEEKDPNAVLSAAVRKTDI